MGVHFPAVEGNGYSRTFEREREGAKVVLSPIPVRAGEWGDHIKRKVKHKKVRNGIERRPLFVVCPIFTPLFSSLSYTAFDVGGRERERERASVPLPCPCPFSLIICLPVQKQNRSFRALPSLSAKAKWSLAQGAEEAFYLVCSQRARKQNNLQRSKVRKAGSAFSSDQATRADLWKVNFILAFKESLGGEIKDSRIVSGGAARERPNGFGVPWEMSSEGEMASVRDLLRKIPPHAIIHVCAGGRG